MNEDQADKPRRISPFAPERYADLDVQAFWRLFRNEIVRNEEILDLHNSELRALMTRDRVNNVARLESFSEDEMAWLVSRSRRRSSRGKERMIRVYRAHEPAFLTGYIWHTSRDHAVNTAEGLDAVKLVNGLIYPKHVIQRIEDGGRKLVLTFPEFVKVQSIQSLTPVAQET